MKRYCPICENYSAEFKPFGIDPREDAQCPVCGSLERHRLLWIYITKHTDFRKSQEKKMLHVAPEKIFQQKFLQQLGENYLSADLYDDAAMVKMDITDIDYEDGSFDYIYCSHVLEHVEDDKKAMREFYRVLKEGGWAILLVPIMNIEQTFEDLSITDPDERIKIFGHPEHVRNYGRDYKQRLQECGWSVEMIMPQQFLTQSEIVLMGITKAAGEIYFCTKN